MVDIKALQSLLYKLIFSYRLEMNGNVWCCMLMMAASKHFEFLVT